MPRREDIKTILVIGSGPIVIGQACEFDYSGTQGCKALREEGYRVVLVNSNPATIMTDPGVANRTYIEPMTVESLEKVIALREARRAAAHAGRADGAEPGGRPRRARRARDARRAPDRRQPARRSTRPRTATSSGWRCAGSGSTLPRSGVATSLEQARQIVRETGIPAIIRPSFTLGGTGGSIAFAESEFDGLVEWALQQSPRHQCLIEESVLGWKEFELEVMRDHQDNVVIICSIENFDPMGVHTGDSITVAPAQTLTDREYQEMRDAAVAIIREIGVDTGGSNIQFAVNPRDGKLVVIEMNPRVSRSSALASKATGFPIAKIAAKLAVGYTLDEIRNDITRVTPASFEPSIDYVVTKIPRFTFEKFPGVDNTLTTQMKSVGEVMAIGRTFKESLQKAIRSLEIGHAGFEPPALPDGPEGERALWAQIDMPAPGTAVGGGRGAAARRLGRGAVRPLGDRSLVPAQHRGDRGARAAAGGAARRRSGWIRCAPPSRRASPTAGWRRSGARARRRCAGCGRRTASRPVYKRVDTCAAEFEAFTPYLYSTYEDECEARPTQARKVMILGGGPNRIGQGIEFDYCCVHASFALREAGFETIMVNCNPETVSTDYDTSDRLYFEPLTLEDVLAIVEKEKPLGLIVQFGGQTPLRLALPLERAGAPILGTSPDSIDRAEDRERFDVVLEKLGLRRPPGGVARSTEEAERVAARIGYPVLVRPSYVLGGRAMEIVYDVAALRSYMRFAVKASPEHPVLVDRFLADATEVDVDAISDGRQVVIGGIMEHIEQAGIHSGDSACSIPPYSLTKTVIDEILESTRRLALELGVKGLMNVQYAVKAGAVYVIEVNPRASRTVPFVSKAIGRPLAKLAALVMVGKTLEELGFTSEIWPRHFSVKEAVFPFVKFPGADTLLGPEMKSTGEVMGIDSDFGRAYAKAQIEAGNSLPSSGTVLVSVRLEDRAGICDGVRELAGQRLPGARHAGDGRGAARARRRGRDGAEGRTGAGRARRGAADRGGRRRSGDQHRRSRGGRRARLGLDQAGRAAAKSPLLHDARRRPRRRRRHPRAPARIDRRAGAPGHPSCVNFARLRLAARPCGLIEIRSVRLRMWV